MHILDLAGIAIYFIAMLYIGYRSSKKVQSSNDFAVAGNKITWPILFATLAASFLGGGASMGRAGQTFDHGYAFMFAAMAFPIATMIVGVFIAPKLKKYKDAHTVGDIMEYHYGVPARIFTGVFSLLFCVGILGAQALAIGTVFNILLGVDVVTGIVIGMVVVLVYSTMGGMWAVIQTDVIQFVMLGFFLPLTMYIGIELVGGPGNLVASIPELHFSVMGEYSWGVFLSIFIAFLLGETLVPPYTQRALAAPDSRNAKIGYTVAGAFGVLFCFVSSTIGIISFVLYPDTSPDQALPTLIRNALPVGLTGLVLASLLAVVMSTADSYLNSASVVFVKDIYTRFYEPNCPEEKKLKLERGVNLVIGLGAIAFALMATDIIDALLMSYALWAPTILIPFMAGVLLDIKCNRSAILAILAGAVVTSCWKWGPWDLQGITGLSALIAGVVANISVFITSRKLFSQKPTLMASNVK
ncbi:sodium:solute symporter family protein [Photobacterium atrarenae]|uniref:Sodium:solute symporter family protein n=1 Tax=Photobacterium atrarenae TaxID=865757 RepID=A0ABY5GPH9_9GAMM|nr:sodium:solute symporter family protein [Photobacterium atrarenae]UTV30730.1 sodium:solute symporter family protein [Photobacterium atrarenae]